MSQLENVTALRHPCQPHTFLAKQVDNYGELCYVFIATVGETLYREPKGKETGRKPSVSKLSGKRTAVGKTSGETSVGGHRRGKSVNSCGCSLR